MMSDGEVTTLLDLFSSSVLTERPENASYLTELPCLPLSDLLSTPTSLSTQSHTLTASLNALAHTSYPTILSLHHTSSALLHSLSSLDATLHTFLDTALPALDDVARTFCEKSGPTVIEERQRTRLVLEQYDKLRDLLDVPVLIDTCVRNGLYAEALVLAGHATTALATLSTSTSTSTSTAFRPQHQLQHHQAGEGGGEPPESDGCIPPLPLVSALQAEIASSLHAMRSLLLGTLHEPGRKLPAFWKAVQFLRRMQVMPESELALAFVSARIDCLQHALQGVERDAGVSVGAFNEDGEDIAGASTAEREKELDRRAEDVARFLKKYVDVWREGAHDLVTQYTTIFLERSLQHGYGSTPSTAPLPDPVIKHTLPSTLLGLLLPTLKTYLRYVYPHLSPLATQLAYCSSAMARIGMDFRLLLSSLIIHAVIDGFTRDVKIGAEREWSSTFAKHTWSSGSKPTPPSKWLVTSARPLPALPSICIPPSSTAHAPPQVLTTFPPLAVTLNTYLRALNRLRALAPMGALGGVRDTLESGLARHGEALLEYAREWRGDVIEKETLRAVGAAYAHVLVPFLLRAIVEGVFGIAFPSDTGSDAPRNGAAGAIRGHGVGGGATALADTLGNWERWLSDTEASS